MAGYGLADAVREGRIGYLPVRLSAMAALLADVVRPDVAVVTGVRRGSKLAFGMTVGWAAAAARTARKVVVEVDEEGIDLGGPEIPGNIVSTITRPRFSDGYPLPRPPGAIDRRIAEHVISVLPRHPILQFGPGGVAEAIMAAIEEPVGIWSGLVTDSLLDLEARGLLAGPATTAYIWGGQRFSALAQAGRLRLLPVEETHDLTRLSGMDRYVACNTALQVGLDGSVNVERAGGRPVAGVGGHPDFCTAASRSVGGLSIIAMPSLTKTGGSTIVPTVDTTSTPRSDVSVVVTEYGVADLRGLDDDGRSSRLISVAAPEHRDRLRDAASRRDRW
jgi:acyl-CoA hydrolase